MGEIKLLAFNGEVDKTFYNGVQLMQKLHKNNLINLNTNQLLDLKKQRGNKLTIAFVGQYSAGKSSLIKMLTGIDSVKIGAGITTDKATEYDWNGVSVIDTPGIETGKREDHDKISYEAISKADMLVFVVTNELFDSHIGNHFRKLAIENQKAKEMLLVINKMSRVGENSLETRDIIKKDLEKVLAPITPDDVYITFTDAKYFFESCVEDNEQYRNYLMSESGYKELVDNLNRFIEEKNVVSKFTTPLYYLKQALEDVGTQIQCPTDDEDLNDIKALKQAEYNVLRNLQREFEYKAKAYFSKQAEKIRDIGRDEAGLYHGILKESDLEKIKRVQISNGSKVNEIIAETGSGFEKMFAEHIQSIATELNKIANTEAALKLNNRLEVRAKKIELKSKQKNNDKVVKNVKNVLNESERLIVKYTSKTGKAAETLKDLSGSKVHEIIKYIGEKIGYKFKPWEAIRLTEKISELGKLIGKFNKFLPFLTTLWELYQLHKESEETEKYEKQLADAKYETMHEYNKLADNLENEGNKSLLDVTNQCITPWMTDYQNEISEINRLSVQKNDYIKELNGQVYDIVNLISRIHESILS